METKNYTRLADLGVYGFDMVEPVIYAALVTEDPLLLIGASGTGKTYLLNSLSEVLALDHRHYNASLISFDDLVGFPFPAAEQDGVKFLQTPATVWGAQSVLIDEISRCKPEHQNRLFSLVHERRVQGIPLPGLRYRWAAMNPCSCDQDVQEDYSGSEPLDPALADRFALFVKAHDWSGLNNEERRGIADPSGEGKISADGGRLLGQIQQWRREFLDRVQSCPDQVLTYTTTVTTALNNAGVRISPRRSRLMSRSLLAASIVAGEATESLYRLVLEASLPHQTWGVEPSQEHVAAAHHLAWDSTHPNTRPWAHQFMAERVLSKKLRILLDKCDDPDAGTQAVAHFLASASKERAAAFAFAVFPAAVQGRLNIGAEGINDLGKTAAPVLSVNGKITWQERIQQQGSQHPEAVRFAQVLGKLKKGSGRLERAKQFFNWCLVHKVLPDQPYRLEAEIEACVNMLRKRGLT